jgi:FkbM family methyltransferase
VKIPQAWRNEIAKGTPFGLRAAEAAARMGVSFDADSQEVIVTDTQNRPGDVLHNLLKVRYGVTIASCKCQEWIDRMNAWGPEGCLDHIKEIVDHLFDEASSNPNVSIAVRMGLQVPIFGERVGRYKLDRLITEAIAMAQYAPNQSISQDELAIRLETPAHDWPKGWRDWPNVIEYHKNLLAKELAKPNPFPETRGQMIALDGTVLSRWSSYDRPSGGSGNGESATSGSGSHLSANPSRAILIPAGGRCQIYDKSAPQFYFWGAFAAAWRLRYVGCTLPIEFWFLPGEMEEIAHCELFARQVAATCHVVDTSKMRVVHGWQIKINAILQTNYKQILHLDADNIVAKDPTYLFDCQEFKDNAAMFWMDNPVVNDFHGRITEQQWERTGVKGERLNDIETGQILIDKDRAAKALQIIKHFADRADYWEGFNGGERGVWYGDKTSFHVGCKLTNTRHYIRMYGPEFVKHIAGQKLWTVFNAGGFYAHSDSKGSVVFQHACHKKGHLHNGHHIQNLQGNQQIQEAATFKSPLAFLDGSIEDSLRCIAPERMFDIEPDRISREVWMDVFTRNEYLLGPEIPADAVVIDIGANSGAFSYACLRRGAGTVVAFEPGPVAERCSRNCAEFGDRFEVIQRAVWRSDEPVGTLSLAPSHRERHSGSVSAVLPATGPAITASAIDLDSVLRRFSQVHILKLDCEGAEYPILMTSTELHRVEHILGEYHHVNDAWSMEALKAFLESQGFEVYRIIKHEKTHGNFWARRRV